MCIALTGEVIVKIGKPTGDSSDPKFGLHGEHWRDLFDGIVRQDCPLCGWSTTWDVTPDGGER
jgi:hypothetical protein